MLPLLLVLLVFAVWPIDSAAQALRSSVDLVALDVCVRDAHGRAMTGLGAEDFVVVENGRLQKVAVLTRATDVPIDAVLLVDRSASLVGEKDVQARAAARAFAATLGPGDRLEVLGFDKSVTVLRELAPIGSGLGVASWREPHGPTALFDALAVAAHRFVKRPNEPERRRVLILLSDGEDTGSILDEDAVLPALRRSGAVLYAVRLQSGPAGPVPWWLRQFAIDTGGRATAVPAARQLPAWFREVGEEIRTLYRLGYVSSDTRRDGAWRPVSVRVEGAALVRTRTGYYAPSDHDTPVGR